MLYAIHLASLSALALATVGLLSGSILAETFGPVGWAVGLAASVLYASAAYECSRVAGGKLALLAALGACTLGLAGNRLVEGVRDVQATRDASRAAQEGAARAAREGLAACVAEARARRERRGAEYDASGGRAPTATYRRLDAEEAAQVARCEDYHPLPGSPTPAKRVTLATMGGLELIRILAPVAFEVFAGLGLKVLASALARRAEPAQDSPPERKPAGASPPPRSKASAAALKGWETRRAKAAARKLRVLR